jgi:hypothetical protein
MKKGTKKQLEKIRETLWDIGISCGIIAVTLFIGLIYLMIKL